ncbi:Regulator of nonsense transcripts 1 [Phytophthora cinnamomi]|uniref:Regulator of nonsense transcripts 1 n=1 Tax=Phytophthora cinnamomi TaxID=4785 RepID=UPI003559CF3B|nr:Regulator of nonsense transcripts 1 [Phytophthora cinnamomi]
MSSAHSSLGNSSSSSSKGHDSSSSSSSSSSLDGDVGPATISGPYRVGNSDGDTCSYHALEQGASCRRPRTCYECLNSDVAGVSDGCLLAPSGFCEDMSSYEANLDFRRNTTGEDLGLTGWYNYFPSINSTYCEPSDAACQLCDELVNNGSLSQASHLGHTSQNVSTEVERQFCLGADGCVCIMACETDNWEANMPAECDTNGSNSGNTNNSSTDATSYSTMLIFYLVLQVVLLAVFMYRRGLCRRMAPQRPPPRPEGPYNNVNAITSPSNRLRLSGWRKMQTNLIEREKKQRAMQQPQYMASPRVEGATVQVEEEDTTTPARPLSPQDSARNNDSARAAYTEVQDDPVATVSTCSRERNDSIPSQQDAASVDSDVVVVEGCYGERIATRADRASSTVAMLEARRDAA